MIKFFRKIRQNLLLEGKSGKPALPAGRYLKYAIGEIVLVVIGILIAIQLNEWRNDSLNTKQKKKVLIALKADFEANLTRIDTVYYHQAKSLKIFIETNNLIDSIDYVTDNNVLKANLTHEGGYGYSFNPINGALRSAVSSGDIHLIKNDSLIELLFSWEDLVLDSYEEIESQRSFAKDTYNPLLAQYRQYRDIYKYEGNENGSSHPSDFIGLFKDPLFDNYTQQLTFGTYGYMKNLKGLRVNNLEILNLIEQELKQ
jgi:hypothetical protein